MIPQQTIPGLRLLERMVSFQLLHPIFLVDRVLYALALVVLRELPIYWTQIILIFKRVMKWRGLWDLNTSIILLLVPDVEPKLYDVIPISLGIFSPPTKMGSWADDRLYDALIKRYPFRQIPLMPPKRLAGRTLHTCFL